MITDISALTGSMRLGKERIFAQTDGGLQIVIPRKDEEGKETDEQVIYERAYYELALEVYLFVLFTHSDYSRNDFIRLERVTSTRKQLSKISSLRKILCTQAKYLQKCLLLSHIPNTLCLIKR